MVRVRTHLSTCKDKKKKSHFQQILTITCFNVEKYTFKTSKIKKKVYFLRLCILFIIFAKENNAHSFGEFMNLVTRY